MTTKIYTIFFIFTTIIFSLVACQPTEETVDVYGTGAVVDLTGAPITNASVTVGGETVATDEDGRFTIKMMEHAQWAVVDHPYYVSRTRAIAPDQPIQISLTPDDGKVVTLHFGGDVMFGRRFFDLNEDGDTTDRILPISGGVQEHLALLEPIQPLLSNADLTYVNLESPLYDSPYVDKGRTRPSAFHPSKKYVFASHPTAAEALQKAGVDVVGLGNNHIFDAQEEGLTSTINALNLAGLKMGRGAFGAGLTESDAWAPAVSRVNGQEIAFLGCTAITGREHIVSYVANDDEGKGGAAACSTKAIEEAVSNAASRYDVTIMMIHGGYEYSRTPSNRIQSLTQTARDAGATLVINHHPHVTGGFDWDGKSMVAWTLGNLVFDQTVWPTFESYILAVQVRDGEVIRAYAEPLVVENYVPKGVTGELADFVARRTTGLSSARFVVDSGAVESDFARQYGVESVTASSENDSEILKIPAGMWVADHPEEQFRVGRDLLWVGSFEDHDIDADRHEGLLWDIEGPYKTILSEAAMTGDAGLRLESNTANDHDTVATHSNRILIDDGANLSLVGQVRGTRGSDVMVQLNWYADTKGGSFERSTETVVLEPNEWRSFRLDATAPSNAVAVAVYLRLAQPAIGNDTADFDDIALIEWADFDPAKTAQYNYVELLKTEMVILNRSVLQQTQ